ncbi:MAG: thioredoxin [Lachnospiraceae bacterium]|nr:thioredoxin [Lachnospiraceae bacterium]
MQPSNKKRILVQCAFLIAAVLMIVHGTGRGEIATVWNKAVNICLECIGLG